MRFRLPNNKRVIKNLANIGLPEIPLFGVFSATTAETALPIHTHGDCMEIHYFKSGNQVFMVDGQIYNVMGGDLFVTFPYEKHGTANHPLRGIIYWMQVRLPDAAPKDSFLGLSIRNSEQLISSLKLIKTRHFQATKTICRLFEDTYLGLENDHSPHLASKTGLRIALWLSSVVDAANDSPHRRITSDIAFIMKMIDDTKDTILTVEQLAKQINLSKISFQLRFKNQVGVAPHDYIIDRKISSALELLTRTDDSVTEVAYKLGFCNSQYFSTVFKRYVGLTPLAYRKREAMPHRKYPANEGLILDLSMPEPRRPTSGLGHDPP